MATEILDDAFFKVLEVKTATYFNLVRLRKVADGIELDDAATVRQLSSVTNILYPLSTTVSGLVSTVDFLVTHGGSGGDGDPAYWSGFPALSNVNMAGSSINSTLNIQVINGTSSHLINYNTVENLIDVSTVLSTLLYYNAVEACMIVQNTHAISTLSSVVSSIETNLIDVSTILSTLTYYNAVAACMIVQNSQGLSTLSSYVDFVDTNVADVSSVLSTLLYYNAIEACLIVTNTQGLSTLGSSVQTISNTVENQASRKSVPFSSFTIGTTPTSNIIATVVSTLGWVNTFSNGFGSTTDLELEIGSIGVWPNVAFDAMRFSHIGDPFDNDVQMWLNNKAQAASYIGNISPGETFTYIFKPGVDPNIGENRVLSTNYIRIVGH
jgi:hypothetical protein